MRITAEWINFLAKKVHVVESGAIVFPYAFSYLKYFKLMSVTLNRNRIFCV